MDLSELDSVKEDIRALLISSNEGITVDQLNKDYEQFNGQGIPYGNFGYLSLSKFLKSITDIVKIEGYGSSALLYPVINPKSEHLHQLISKQRKNKKKQRFHYNANYESSTDSSDITINKKRVTREWNPPPPKGKSKKKLEEINYYVPSLPDVEREIFPADAESEDIPLTIEDTDEILFIGFPDDAVRFANSIEFIPNISDIMTPIDNWAYPVRITYIRTPYKFWFHLENPNNSDLEMVTADLHDYYESLDDNDQLMPEYDIKEGRACVVRYKGKWYRGKIIDGMPTKDGDYKIFCLDYGMTVKISPKNIKFMKDKYGRVPRQAFRGRLAFIQPQLIRWTREAAHKFEFITQNYTLYAEIVHYDPKDDSHYLKLLQFNTDEDIDVAKYIIKKCPDTMEGNIFGKSIVSLKIPSFDMLEKGLTPLSSEFAD